MGDGGGTGPHPRSRARAVMASRAHTPAHLDTPPALLARLGAVSLYLMTILGEHILIQV